MTAPIDDFVVSLKLHIFLHNPITSVSPEVNRLWVRACGCVLKVTVNTREWLETRLPALMYYKCGLEIRPPHVEIFELFTMMHMDTPDMHTNTAFQNL